MMLTYSKRCLLFVSLGCDGDVLSCSTDVRVDAVAWFTGDFTGT